MLSLAGDPISLLILHSILKVKIKKVTIKYMLHSVGNLAQIKYYFVSAFTVCPKNMSNNYSDATLLAFYKGNPLVTSGSPPQRSSNEKGASKSRYHHVLIRPQKIKSL